MKKVLIVDDQPNIRWVLRLALSQRFVISEATSADMALTHLQNEIPDAIVLDVMMPGSLNGFQLCERIKKDEKWAAIHVVLVTACGQVEEQELGRALGADAYFIKPFSAFALERHLTDALKMTPTASPTWR